MLDQVKTVQDLVKLNEEQVDEPIADQITKAILDKEPSVGIEVVKNILDALINFHEEGTEMYIKEDKAQFVAAWARDVAYLNTARVLLEDIQLWKPVGFP